MNESFPARDNLHVLVGRKLADGDLPRGPLGAVAQTDGSSEVCDACAKHVSPSDVLYRVYSTGYRRFRFHRACFAIWREECALTRASPSKRTVGSLALPSAASTFGVFGMLAVLVFCLRAMQTDAVWAGTVKFVRVGFWGLNVGLALSVAG